MDQKEAKELLEKVKNGQVDVDEAVLKLREAPFDDLGFAKVDHHRALRQGMAEVIYGAGKTPQQIYDIAQNMLEHGQKTILITRMSEKAKYVFLQHDAIDRRLQEMFRPENWGDDEESERKMSLYYDELSHVGIVGEKPAPDGVGKIVIATGGTSDVPVAEEAALTAECFGNEVVRLYDVGVAGIHRLFAHEEEIMNARCIVAIAGMEGALASVIGGLADCPVIAVPTSVGYGANFGGLSALLSMLNSCASGVSVVNIDNGFGAGYLASMINHLK